MSGATPAQIGSFTSNYLPYATQAGAALGVSPTTVLAQWALESGYGTSNLATGSNNLAGLTTPGSNGASFQSFNSVSDFEQAYVNTIAGNFPGAENTGTDLSGFVTGLSNGTSGSYFGSTPAAQYTSTLAGALANLTSAGATPSVPPMVTTGLSNNTAGSGTGASSTGSASTGGVSSPPATTGCGVISGLFTWSCWQNIITDLAFVGIGVLIFIVAVASGLFGEHAQAAARSTVRRVT